MRINKYLAQATALSRRKADSAIAAGRVQVNGLPALEGQAISATDVVTLDNRAITPAVKTLVMLNKPVGYVVSRDGQGSRTIYDLLPPQYQLLKPIGRLDKNSSGLLLLTNDGDLAQTLTHPSQQKDKVYQVSLYKPLTAVDRTRLTKLGVQLEDGLSKFSELTELGPKDGTAWTVVMHEGRNRQIRRTFAALNYEVKTLHRTHFGEYELENLMTRKHKLQNT